MSEPILSRSDINSLYQIVDEANKAYLKESRLNDKPAFNILRVLAALRLLYQQSPPALYNAVLFITKNYNPQTYYHWKKSIEELSKNRNALFKSKSNYCRPEINTYTKTYQNSFNRSRINESQHLQSKSYAQINIPQEMNTSKQESFELEDQKDVSQTNAQTGKRQFYTKADSISHVSKNHYISFEPYRHSIDYHNHYYDKENINSTNVEESRKKQSAYQYIEAIQRDLIRTAKNSQTKTPIDQSFIKNINSSESPFLFTKMPHEIHDPIQDQMRARADTFYQFNLKLKVISSLQANSYVFLKAKENQIKSKLQYQSKLLQKSFLSIQQNVKICQQVRRKQEKSDQHFKKTLSSKVLNILKLIFELKKKSQVQKKPQIAKYNKVNYEFVLNLLFSLNRANEEENVNFIDFQNKINELIHSDEANKLFLIVKYFGKHSWATQQNIQNVINLYKQRTCRLVFNAISKQQESNMKYHAVREKNLKKQSFFALKIRWNRFACYKQKVQTAQNKRNRTLLQKVMKSMLQTVYSTKLYSKRCEYIERKHLYHLKAKTYKAWLSKAKVQIDNKVMLSSKALKLLQKMQCFIKKIVMKRINNEIQAVQNRVKMVVASNMQLKKIECFKSLKQNIQNARKTKECWALMQKYRCSVAVAKWKEITSKGKALSNMMKLIKRFYFRQIVLPNIEESIQIIKSIQFTEFDIQRKCLKAIKRNMIQQKRNRENLIETFKNKVSFMKKSLAVSLLKFDFQIQKSKRERKTINQKTQILLSRKISAQKYAFIDHFKVMHHDKVRKITLQASLMNVVYQSASLQLLNRLRDISLTKANGSKLRQFIKKGKMNMCGRQFLGVIFESKMRKVEAIRREKASLSFGITLQNIYGKQSKQRQLSTKYRNLLLCSKTFQGFEILVQQSKAVKQIANKVKSKKSWDVVKDSLQYSHKINKVAQSNKRCQIKMAIGKLRKQKFTKASQTNFLNWRATSLKRQLLNKMKVSGSSKKQSRLLAEQTDFLHKWQGISRLQHFYISNLISKKHLYMAIKFRALKLCLNSFKVLSSSKQPRKRGSSMLRHKGLAQRLSTDINE